uniref:Mce/MlaD domain-containing protein n=1 Tax=Dasya naccarioides TaxID=2007180 RepID=A0A1Z1MH33_9FLOR|nr:hypothetical protein [Dasya naccarioides]ARW65135.1 hypothetical protein [Dasya naccarioides]
MNYFQLKKFRYYCNKLLSLFLLIFCFYLLLSLFKKKISKGYSLFFEFNNAYGIKNGTQVNFRGVQVGYIKKIYMKVNSIVFLVYIQSDKIIIPKKSIIETNQTGLFNDTVIDIVPLNKIQIYNYSDIVKNNLIDVFSKSCLNSNFLCNYHYLYGTRGLNYDDLIRAVTRISQRFDDPRFFSVFYMFLNNTLDISEDILNILRLTSDICNLLAYFIEISLLKYL